MNEENNSYVANVIPSAVVSSSSSLINESSSFIKEAFTFSCTDFMEQTPEWALYKSQQKGFDPIENRWRRNKHGEKVEIQYKASDSGCG